MTLTKIAYWHAATATIGELEPNTVDLFRDSVLATQSDVFDKMVHTVLSAISSQATNWPGYETIAKKLLNMATILVRERGEEVYTKKPEDFNVLNHGDLWSSNIMYKHNDFTGKLDDVVMVDYSIGYWGNPGLDLSYFLFSSSAENITEEDWDHLLMHYYVILSDTLKKLKYPKRLPRYFEIYQKFLFGAQFTWFMATMVASLRQLEDIEKGHISNLMDDTPEANEFRLILYSNPNFRKSAERLLKYTCFKFEQSTELGRVE